MCAYVECVWEVSTRQKSISKQCVCITRYQAVLISRSHITEKYVVLPYKDLLCAIASLQGDAQRTEHMTWYMLREKYRNPQRPYKQKNKLQHRCGIHCFPGETTPSYVEHVDSNTRL